MPIGLNESPFQPINSTAPAFNSTAGTSAAAYALESTGAREWQFPSNRSIRLVNLKGDDFYFMLGTSDVSIGSTLSNVGIAMLGGVSEVFSVRPGQTHISFYGSSTDVAVNATLGTGY